LLAGILAAQGFDSILIGDSSLSSRPMKRIIEPLTAMGAKIKSNEDGELPLFISSTKELNTLNYQMPVTSAQVKSAILLTGLHLSDETKVFESVKTRNHTENLLGLKVIKEGDKIISTVSRNNFPEQNDYFIPGDISSAMFFIVLTLLAKNSQLVLKDVSLNPTRTECLNILKKMGGNITIEGKGESNQEEFGDIIVKSSELSNVEISNEIIPQIIDEVPALTIAGIFAEGNFEIRSAQELRVKESDRINALCINLNKLGLDVEELEDGFVVSGNMADQYIVFDSFGDHRIAMAFAILSTLLDRGGQVKNFDCVKISNPDFLQQINSIGN
jgi:3-phosphoshikimate 1-carboxyvinyltransferase